MDQKNSVQKRQVAYKVRIKEMIQGSYIRDSGWEPNHVLFGNGQKVSRVNIMGTIVDKSPSGSIKASCLMTGAVKSQLDFFRSLIW